MKPGENIQAKMKNKVLNILVSALVASMPVGVSAQSVETPTMGWSSWNTYGFQISESIIKKQAKAMVDKGFDKVGYQYINIDDGYFGGRDASGKLKIHPTRFPNGMKPVVDYIHSLGLKAGIYSDGGHNTCASFHGGDKIGEGVGLYEHDQQDCDLFFKELDFDFIKVDFCGGVDYHNNENLNLDEKKRYTEISQAIKNTGKEGVRLNVCRWAYPGTWVNDLATSWRTTGDIYNSWESVRDILAENLYMSAYCHDGHYNDMDMLEVGRGMTAEEDRTHFAMWCIMSSPLLIGCDMSKIEATPLALLKNKELIELNQNSLGLQAYIAEYQNGCYILVKDLDTLHGTVRAFAVYNPTDTKQTVKVNFSAIELGGKVKLRNLITKAETGEFEDYFELNVPAHGTRVYKATAEKRVERTMYEAETGYIPAYQELKWPSTGSYVADAKMSGGYRAEWLGNAEDSGIEWRDVFSLTGGEYYMTIAYLSGESRNITVKVNGEDVATLKSLNSGGWGNVSKKSVKINLKKGHNTIYLYNKTAYMPNIDYMSLKLITPLEEEVTPTPGEEQNPDEEQQPGGEQQPEVVPTLKEFQNVWSADKGDGTFVNPILNVDAPDIDVIRVGDTYYMVTTTMFIFPGATIFKSKDLVNWEYCCNPLKTIESNDAYNLMNGQNHYGQGQWATSLKYHDGKFYLYFISYGRSGVDSGKNVLLTATDPEGTWSMKFMNEHYYDAGWMFDDGENGDGYLYVACGISNITVNKLDPKTLKKISEKQVIKDRESFEGSHMYHIGEYYYLYLTTGGYWRGQTIFRSKDPMGPYEECPNGNVQAGSVFSGQGIHQGGLVETQTGEWWTIMFKDAGAIGRIPYLEPVEWKDGWPIIGNKGVDVSKNSKAFRKPNVGAEYPRTYLPTNDPFSQSTLGLQWGWNHNPMNNCWSLTQRPGWLRLKTSYVPKNVTQARNMLTQRIPGYSPEGTASSAVKNSYGTAKFDVSGMIEGDVCGLCVFQDNHGYVGVKVVDGKKYIVQYINNFDGTIMSEKLGPELTSDIVYLRVQCRYGTSKAYFYYSFDNETFTRIGNVLDMNYTLRVFTGNRFGLFIYRTKNIGGYVDIDWFTTETGTFNEEDYYTEEYLYPNGKPDAIEAKREATPTGKTEYYSLSGIKLSVPQKGFNVIKHSDGTTSKVIY